MTAGHEQLTKEQFIENAARMCRRVSADLDRLDAGDLDTLDSLATIVRAALGDGRGNDVVNRLCKQNHVPSPSVIVGPPPRDERSTVFSVGYVPSEPQKGDAVQPTVSVREWRQLPAVISKGNVRRTTKWHQLASDFGNTVGAHISQTIPKSLTDAEMYGAPGGKLDVYLLRAAAVVVEHALTDVLRELRYEGELGGHHLFTPNSASFGGLSIWKEGDDVRTTFWCSVSKAEEVQIATIPIEHLWVTVWTVKRGDASRLEIRTEKRP